MVPIIEKLVLPVAIPIYERLVNSLKTRISFNQELLPIKIENLEKNAEKKLKFLKLKHQEKLLPYEIKAGVESEYFQEKYQFELAKIEDKYYWKNRIVKAKAARKGIDANQDLEMLEKSRQNELAEIKAFYYPKDKDIKSYEEAKKILDNEYHEKAAQINQKLVQDIEKNQTLTQNKIEKYKKSLKIFEKRLAIYTAKKKAKYQIDDNTVLSIKGLSMYFGGLKAVDDLSFDVKEGEIFGLIGPNGAGKTTVFNCITRFYKPTMGEMYFKNAYDEVVFLNNKKVHNIIKEGIVRTFQNVEVVWELNIIDNLLVAAHTLYRSSFFGHMFNSKLLRQEERVMRKKAEKILEDLGLSAYKFAYPLGLPYGILKKIELARTLMANPKLIILDEPAAGLNEAETKDLAEVIKKIRSEYEATIFLVEHDMGLVMSICDTVCAISFGKKLAMGTPKEIQNNKTVQQAYLGGE
jgi:branched-chain amino acid transport system ATP-binding protein